jgi:hypothetical protein
MKERLGYLRGSYRSMKNLIERVRSAIDFIGVFSVLAD